MDYREALEYIHGIYWRGSKLGLARITELLELMGNPQKELRFVHVAGTNGKGSTCAMLASVMQSAGYRTGLYISPYIVRFNERIQYDGVPISDEDLADITEYVSRFAESMNDKPTEFELVTAIGMEYFKRMKCDVVILEVGLGGTLDSTNVIDTPEAAVITALDLDHTRELGNTIEDIASAKAGIIKQGCDVVSYGGDAKALDVIKNKCALEGANLTVADLGGINVKESGPDGSVFDIDAHAPDIHMENVRVPLAGTYQVYNAALVITVLSVLRARGRFRIPDSAVYDGISRVKWPGRFEILRRDPYIIADGAHNPHGIKATLATLGHHFPGCRAVAVLGVMADKDVDSMIDILLPYTRKIFTVRPDNPRAMSSDELAHKINRKKEGAAISCGAPGDGVRAAYDYITDQRAARPGQSPDIICALGSFYMYADIAKAVKAL